MPSLKPNRLRGVACAVEVDDVRPKPSCDQRTATVPKPIRARLRIACTATCGSSAQAWTQRSPPERAGSRSSPGKCGSVAARRGCRSARPKRSLPSASRNSAGPKPKVIVSPRRRQPDRLAGVVGRAGRRRPRSGRPARRPRRAVIRSAASVQACSSATSSSRESVVTSNAAKCSRSWAGVTMPAWCAPRNGYDVATASPGGAAASAAAVAAAVPDDARAGHPGGGRAAAERVRVVLTVHGPAQRPSTARGELRQRLGERVDRVGELP